MALSQLQCLDDNHVNPRTHESKPEFLYCEDQRLALEALLHNGREGFLKCLEARSLRGFLSDPELETLFTSAEPFDPDLEVFSESAEDDDPPLSMHYWPDLSDTTIPQMDLGWPDTEAYRGVTRTTVYSQPPLDGQAHIKEIVRKMIAQAQKVIAVVMDVFTDVDIFRDLLDAGFKKKVSIYILLERTSRPHFLSMCRRANMHAGHLKHLRVRCTTGAEFYSRSSRRVRGQMGHRFMFIDGDRAVSGSYSFTWMSSRLDKNLITVVTGQAVDAFDKLYRTLYSTSSAVDLRQFATEPEPEPEPIPQPVSAPLPSAALARKLYNPKYALVALGNPSASQADNSSPQETPNHGSKTQEETDKKKRKKACKENLPEPPPLHPGLVDLEKVFLIDYLPTWPEPDPPKDVIGFINIRDVSKSNQVHLQRSEMFETSQAIRFSSPFSMPEEKLPEVATPRQIPAKLEEINKPQPAQDNTKAKESHVDIVPLNATASGTKNKAETAEQSSPASGPQSQTDKDTTKTQNTQKSLSSNTTTNQEASHNPAPHLNAHTPFQSGAKKSTTIPRWPAHTSQTVTKKSAELDSLQGSNTKKETGSNTYGSKANSTSRDSYKEKHTQKQTVPSHSESRTQAVHTQSQYFSKKPSNGHTPTTTGNISSSSALRGSENNTNPSSSLVPLCNSSSTTPHLPSRSPSDSSSLTPAAPIPKPRTIQLDLKNGFTSDVAAKKLEAITKPLVIQHRYNTVTVVKTLPDKQPKIGPEQQHNGSTKGAQSTVNTENTSQRKPRSVSEFQNNKTLPGPQKVAQHPAKSRDNSQQRENRATQDSRKTFPGTTLEVVSKKQPKSVLDLQTNKNLTRTQKVVQGSTKSGDNPLQKEDGIMQDMRKAVSGTTQDSSSENLPQNVPEMQNSEGSTKAQKDVQSTVNSDETLQQNENKTPLKKKEVSGTIQEIKAEKQPKITIEVQNSRTQTGMQKDFPALQHENQQEICRELQKNVSTTGTEKAPQNISNIVNDTCHKEANTLQGKTQAVSGTFVKEKAEKTPDSVTVIQNKGITTESLRGTQNTIINEDSTPQKKVLASQDTKKEIPGATLDLTLEKQREIVSGLYNSVKVTEQQKVANSTDAIQLKDAGASQDTKETVQGAVIGLTPNSLITGEPKVESLDTSKNTPGVANPKSLTSTDSKLTQQLYPAFTETKALEKAATCGKLAESPNDSSKKGTNCPGNGEKTPAIQEISNSESEPKVARVMEAGNSTNSTKNKHNNSQELISKSRDSKQMPDKNMNLPLSDSKVSDLSPGTPDKDLRWLTAPARTPTPDGFPLHSPNPESRTQTPDPRSYTPDFRTPTPDISDGYYSAIDDTNLSTASEEFYDCVSSPSLLEPFDQQVNAKSRTTEDYTTNVNKRKTSSSEIQRLSGSTQKVAKGTQENLSSELQSSSGSAKVSSPFKLDKEVRKEEGESANKENGTQGEEKKVAKRAEGAEKADSVVKVKEAKVSVEKNKDISIQAQKKKKVVNQSAAEKKVDGGGTPGTKDKAEPRRLSAGDLKAKTEKEGQDKEKAPSGSSVVIRREKAQAAREPEGQKLLQSSSRTQEERQQDNAASPAARQTRSSRPLSGHFMGPRPWAGSLLNKAESMSHHGSYQVLDNAGSPNKLPSRPPPPRTVGAIGSLAGRRQAEVSHSQQNLLTKASLLLTDSNSQPLLSSHPQSQTLLNNQKADSRVPFSFTFGRLYSLRDLKDKMSKLPTQRGERSSMSSAFQGRKSTS